MKKEAKLVLFKAVIVCFIGFVANTFVSKAIALQWSADLPILPSSPFCQFKWIELTAFQHLFGSALSLVVLAVMGKPIWLSESRLTFVIASLCNVVGTLAANAALSMISSSAARAIEATQPISTFAILVGFLKVDDSITASSFLSMLIIILGILGLIFQDVLYTAWGCLVALILTAAFALRNVLLKQINDNALHKFWVVSLHSAIFVLPLWLLQLTVTHTMSTNGLYALSGVAHSIYSIASFGVLETVSPVTHALLTAIVRVSAFTNLYSFQALFSLNVFLGVAVILIGGFLYVKDVIQNASKAVLVVLICIFLAVQSPGLYSHNNKRISLITPKPTLAQYHSKNTFVSSILKTSDSILKTSESIVKNIVRTSDGCERISTAWTYTSPIPNFAVSNIVTLAEQNPGLVVHVYCGSKQCVDAVEKRKTQNMEVEFVVVSEILRGVSPSLEQWLGRHPINKVLAGREFEVHLQEVTVIGILLKYGGVYVSPLLALSGGLSSVCRTASSGWITEELSLWEESYRSVLDLCFFVDRHPFLSSVGSLYGKEYPTQRNDGSDFSGFLQKVWGMTWNESCTVEEPCVSVLRDIPEISSSNFSPIKGDDHFGLITRSHLGSKSMDQALEEFAEAQFMPFVDTFVNSDTDLSDYHEVSAFFHGMTTAKSEQPPSNINPIMLSVHLEDKPQKQIQYLKEKQPIGCSDSNTLEFLERSKVDAFLSGSLMLLLNTPKSTDRQRDGIYLSNLDDEVAKLLPADIQSSVHNDLWISDGLASSDATERFEATYQLIEHYRSSRLVITQCFHCASACAALGTPVIFVERNGPSSSLAAGTTSLFHTLHLQEEKFDEAREWLADFPWSDIPPNPGLALMMRLRATAWNVVRKNQILLDTAKKLGVVPFSPPRILPEDRKLLFHQIFTSTPNVTFGSMLSNMKQSGAFNWRHVRSIESVLHHHPTSDLILHSNTLSQDMFDVYTEAGYSLKVSSYNLIALLNHSPAKDFVPRLPSARKGPFWIVNEADLVRQLVLYKWGGVYLDLDIYLVRPLHTLRMNGAGWQYSQNNSMNNAFLMFEKGHPFVKEILENFPKAYSDKVWGKCGPKLMTSVWDTFKKHSNLNGTHAVKPYKYTTFFMLRGKNMVDQCFMPNNLERNMKRLQALAYGVHLNAKITGYIGTTSGKVRKGTLCSYLLNHFCVLCDTKYS